MSAEPGLKFAMGGNPWMANIFSNVPNFTFLLISITAALLVRIGFGYVREYHTERKFARLHGCQPVRAIRPYSNLFWGLDLMYQSFRASQKLRFLEMVENQFRDLGPTFAGRNFNFRTISTMDKDNIKAVLADRFYDFELGDRQSTMGPLLGPGIFTSDGLAWKASRDMVKPNFDRKQVADLDAFERHFQEMLLLIPSDGSTVDLQDLFFRLTIDSATEFLFGTSVQSLKTAVETSRSSDSAFATAFNHAQRNAADRIMLASLVWLDHNREAKRSIKTCHEFADQFVDQALSYRSGLEDQKGQQQADGMKDEKNEKYVFLKELAKAKTDRYQLRSELLNILLAGRDTTASLLSNMWFVIARRPDIFKKLKDEVNEQLGGRPPSFEQLRSLKYLKFTMQESLRLHPVVPLNSRKAVKDTYLPHGGGPDGLAPLFVPKGTRVFYSVYAMHRRKDYYGQDAHEFRPERWETTRQGWHYLPFNGGPRICVGQQYALTEAGYVTARILQTFSRIESRDPKPWEESLHLTLSSNNGTQVGLYA